MNHRPLRNLALASILTAAAAGCSSNPPMPTVDYVDLERYMGDWYVIANIPTFLERGAHNAIESYSLNPDGTIATVFTFRKDGFDGEKKRYTRPAGSCAARTMPSGACGSSGRSRPSS
jgi:apolipoprotein D and lipocalin family protein